MLNLTRSFVIYLSLAAISLGGGLAFAAVDPLGFDPLTAENPAGFPSATARGDDCRILYFQNPIVGYYYEFDRLSGLGLDIALSLDPADLNLDNLLQFDVVIIFGMGADGLAEQAAAIETFVSVGGSLFLHQPNDEGTVSFAPPGFEVTVLDSYWCNHPFGSPEILCPVDSTHPLVSGFVSEEMGLVADFTGDLGPGYSLIAIGCDCDDPALAAGEYGAGLVVFDSNIFWNPEWVSDAYILNFMEYLCAGPGPVATRPVSLDGLKVMYH